MIVSSHVWIITQGCNYSGHVYVCIVLFGHHEGILTLPYLTSGVDRLLHLPSAEAISARPNAHL